MKRGRGKKMEREMRDVSELRMERERDERAGEKEKRVVKEKRDRNEKRQRER